MSTFKSKVLFTIAVAMVGCAIAEQWFKGWTNHALASTIGVLLIVGLLVLFFMSDE